MKFRFESDISEFWSIHSFLPWNAVISYIESPLYCLILSIPFCEYIHVAGSHLVFTGTQKQIQFMSIFSCLLALLFSSNMLHLQQRNSIISCLVYSSYSHCFCEDKDTDRMRDTKVVLLSPVCHLHSLFTNARVNTQFRVSRSLSYQRPPFCFLFI